MGKLDRRLVGDTYEVAYGWDLIKLPGIIIFHTPKVVKEIEEAVGKEVEREQAVRKAVNEAIGLSAKEAIVNGMKKTLSEAKKNDRG